ncbi:hypothetical protein [Novosphingobium terrae]|jgi:cytochrome c5|uniref:hypothetical protein n=1 Tax=Novosphingobium terrae TaxID=2726189 RepID=UPI00197F1171|nr:hypothetical protein [Novosphingobium terrae]
MSRRPPILIAIGLFCASAIHAQNAAPTPAPATLTPGAGMEAVQTTCTVCHPAAMITGKHLTRQQWSDLVDQMINKGAQVSDENYDVILSYLSRNYGAGK